MCVDFLAQHPLEVFPTPYVWSSVAMVLIHSIKY